ncbi:MAG: DUF1566 domain-containing protein [Minicystis sp.]
MHRGWLCAASFLGCLGFTEPTSGERADSFQGAILDADPLCVEPGRFSMTQELVVDKRNDNRVWQRRVSERLPHAEAVRYCANLVLEGSRGFRLPSPQEIGTLKLKAGGLFGGRGRHYCVPSIDQAAFPETPAAEFWTSRIMPDGTAWYMGFDDGRMHRDDVNDPLWVRCVRDAR